MAALSKKVALLASVAVLEMLVVRRAAIFAVELGFQHVSFESDSEGVIKSLAVDSSYAVASHLVKDFKSLTVPLEPI